MTRFTIYFNDDSSSNLSVSLVRLFLNGSGYGILADLQTTGAPGLSSAIDTTINSATIDNTAHSYSVRAYCTAWDGFDLKIRGAVIRYTVDEAE